MGFERVSSLMLKKITTSFSSRELTILCGNINIEHMKLDCNGKSYVDMMICLSLEQRITLSTRIVDKSVKLIYHIWSNSSSTVQSGIFDTGKSDHDITLTVIPSCIERN